MGRSVHRFVIPFFLGCKRENADDPRLEANFEDPPEEWEPVNGWEVQGMGDIIGDTQWKKDDFVVEVGYMCMMTRSGTYFAAKDRASLEAWKRDHKLKGEIRENEEVFHTG